MTKGILSMTCSLCGRLIYEQQVGGKDRNSHGFCNVCKELYLEQDKKRDLDDSEVIRGALERARQTLEEPKDRDQVAFAGLKRLLKEDEEKFARDGKVSYHEYQESKEAEKAKNEEIKVR